MRCIVGRRARLETIEFGCQLRLYRKLQNWRSCEQTSPLYYQARSVPYANTKPLSKSILWPMLIYLIFP
jgi:hypothetical protein